jgi:hypothetical protein
VTGGNKTESIQSEPAAGGRLLPKGKARDSRDTMNLLRKFILASFWGASILLDAAAGQKRKLLNTKLHPRGRDLGGKAGRAGGGSARGEGLATVATPRAPAHSAQHRPLLAVCTSSPLPPRAPRSLWFCGCGSVVTHTHARARTRKHAYSHRQRVTLSWSCPRPASRWHVSHATSRRRRRHGATPPL